MSTAQEENTRLRQQVQSLLDEKQKLVTGLKAKLATLISQKNEFQKRADELDIANAQLQNQINSRPAPQAGMGGTPEQLMARINQLENEQKIIHEKIKFKLQTLVSEKYELTMKEHALMQNQIDPAALQRLRNQLALLHNEKNVLTQKIYEQSSAIQNAAMWKKQNQQLRANIQKVEGEYILSTNKVAEQQADVTAKAEELRNAVARLAALREKKEDYEKKIAEERSSQHNSSLWQVQNEALRNQARILQNEVTINSAKLADYSRSAEDRASNAGVEHQVLMEQREANTNAISDLIQMIKDTKANEERLIAQKAQLELEYGNTIAEKQGLVMRIRQFQRKGEEIAARNDKVRKKLLELEDQRNKGMLIVEELSAKLQHVEDQDKLNDDLRFELAEELDRNDMLVMRIERLQESIVESGDSDGADELTNSIMEGGMESDGSTPPRATHKRPTIKTPGRSSITLKEKKKTAAASLRETSQSLSRNQTVGDILTAAKDNAEKMVDERGGESATEAVEDGVDTAEIMFVQEKDTSAVPSPNKCPQIRCATLEKLVERLTYEKFPDMEYVQSFMLTYRSFTTPLDLLELVIARYCIVPPLGISEEEIEDFKNKKQTPIRLRVFNVLKSWISEHTYDFENEQLCSTVEDFINNTMPATKMGSAAKTLQRTLQRKLEEQKMEKEASKAALSNLRDKDKIKHFKDVDTRELAIVITLREQELYRRIQPKECFGLAWSKKNKEESSPNILAFVRNFNEMSQWVQYEIMSGVPPGKHSDRGKLIKKMIRLASDLCELNNFNGAMEIIAGLGASALYRLKNAWGKVDKAANTRMDELKEDLGNKQNYKKLRSLLHMANPPCIPYFGMYLTDLTFIEDGNPDLIEGLINFNKRRLYATVLREIQQYQQMKYTQVEDPATHLFLNEHLQMAMAEMPTEDEAYALSLKVEPRGT